MLAAFLILLLGFPAEHELLKRIVFEEARLGSWENDTYAKCSL